MKKRIILENKNEKRENRQKSFKKMNKNGDDKLLIPDIFIDEKNI